MVTKVQRTQLFKGFSSQDNNKKVLYDIELIKQDLINHFQTRVGERVMMPTFGCIVWDVLFEPFTEALRDEIIDNVRRILEFDTRVEVETLTVDEFEHGIIIKADVLYKPFDVLDSFTLQFDKRSLEEE